MKIKNKKMSDEQKGYCLRILIALEMCTAHGESTIWDDILDHSGCSIEDLVFVAQDVYNMYLSGLIYEGYVDTTGKIVPKNKREDAREKNKKYHPLYGISPIEEE